MTRGQVEQAERVDPTELLKRSDIQREEGDHEASYLSLTESLRKNPHDVWALAHRGDLLYEKFGRYREAILDFNQALTIRPDYTWALAHRGATYERLNRYGAAESDLSRALSFKPKYTWARAMMVRVYQFTRRYEKGLEAIEQVIAEQASIFPYWREERAMMRMLVGKYKRAEHYFKIALQVDPDDRYAQYNSVVNIYHWRGRAVAKASLDKHEEHLERKLAHNSDPLEVVRCIYELGGLAVMRGQFEEALTRLAEATRREEGMVLLSPSAKRSLVDMAWLELRSDERYLQLTPAIHRN